MLIDEIQGKLLDIDFQRKVAKVGMVASMGLLCATSFNLQGRGSKNIHTISGIALVGFSLWHAMLYETPYARYLSNKTKSHKREKREKSHKEKEAEI
ncbi:helicase [uncultured Campylobacter sp.]|uniref:helicase n=1 Tax=uncultured Campylobacter sp. TaxID=218934 RepID=UPI002631061C|nr:helicase [uncultured Campylobacter sp.]